MNKVILIIGLQLLLSACAGQPAAPLLSYDELAAEVTVRRTPISETADDAAVHETLAAARQP